MENFWNLGTDLYTWLSTNEEEWRKKFILGNRLASLTGDGLALLLAHVRALQISFQVLISWNLKTRFSYLECRNLLTVLPWDASWHSLALGSEHQGCILHNLFVNKLAKLGEVIAISKSETINHSPTDWQGQLLGDAIASKKGKSGRRMELAYKGTVFKGSLQKY